MKINVNISGKVCLSQVHEGEAFVAAEDALFIRLQHSDLWSCPDGCGIPIVNLSNGCFTFASADLEVRFASVKIVPE